MTLFWGNRFVLARNYWVSPHVSLAVISFLFLFSFLFLPLCEHPVMSWLALEVLIFLVLCLCGPNRHCPSVSYLRSFGVRQPGLLLLLMLILPQHIARAIPITMKIDSFHISRPVFLPFKPKPVFSIYPRGSDCHEPSYSTRLACGQHHTVITIYPVVIY